MTRQNGEDLPGREISVERWSCISRLFTNACERPREAWEAYLEREADGDRNLVSQVMVLLEEDRRPTAVHEVIREEARSLADRPAGEPSASPVGREIGPYRILEQIGHGGMGTVYRARRELCGACLTVALKLIRPGMDTRLVVQRFERERKVLAGLQHPNIARLLDAGATEDGRPFLVMDFVEGEPIDVDCARRDLSVRGRVRLFLEVCAAVQHAHQSLVVHCDLKPSNVLVTADGSPRLLDFGLARILESTPTDEPVTVAGQRWMTPEYASPEQASSGRLTTATDVFGLGALLYHLLAGRPPFRFSSRDPLEVARILRDVDPRPPSRARAESTAATGGRTVREQQIGHDLDCIVLKALAKDPRSRYISAEELAQDLHRWLRGRPVRARRWTWRYRARRFLARHRRWGAGLAAVLAVLGASLATHLGQAREAAELRQRVAAENARAAEVAAFLVNLFESTDPDHDRGSELSARDLVDRGLDRARRELADRPLLRLTIFNTMSRSYRKLGYFEPARELATEALALGRELRLEDQDVEAETAASLETLGWVCLDEGSWAEARVLFRRALVLKEDRFGMDGRPVADALEGLLTTSLYHGDFLDAREVAERRVEILRRASDDPDDPDVAGALADLASVEGYYGDANKAVELLDTALPILEKHLARHDRRLATARFNYGQILFRRGAFDRARLQLAQAFAAYEELLGPDHLWVGRAAGALAMAELWMHDYERAEQLLERALAIFMASQGNDAVDTATMVHNRGILELRRGDLDAAQAWFRRSLDTYVKVAGRGHPHAAASGHHLGVIARRQARLDEAEEILDWVLAVRREKLGPDHHRLASTLHEIGLLRLAQGRLQEGEGLLREAYDIRRRGLPDDHPEFAESLTEIGRLEASRGESVARERFERALCIVRGQEVLDEALEASLSSLLAEQGGTGMLSCT